MRNYDNIVEGNFGISSGCVYMATFLRSNLCVCKMQGTVFWELYRSRQASRRTSTFFWGVIFFLTFLVHFFIASFSRHYILAVISFHLYHFGSPLFFPLYILQQMVLVVWTLMITPTPQLKEVTSLLFWRVLMLFPVID